MLNLIPQGHVVLIILYLLCFQVNEVSMSGDDDSKWSLIMQSAACVKKVVDTIKSRWEAQFETTLPVLRK